MTSRCGILAGLALVLFGAGDGRVGFRGKTSFDAHHYLSKIEQSLLRTGHASPREFGDLRQLSTLDLAGQKARVEIHLRWLSGELLQRFDSIGVDPEEVYPNDAGIIARANLQALIDIASWDEVLAIHASRPPRLMGALSPRGRCGHGIEEFSPTGGFSEGETIPLGKDVKIGIISDTFVRTIEEAQIDDNENPCNRRVLLPKDPANELSPNVFVVQEGPLGGTDEGRALAEIIGDLAPEAEIYFHTAGSSPSAMAEAVETLASCGVQVIVTDVRFDREPMFQDGVIAQEVEEAVESGIAYFAAAGNDFGFGIDEIYDDVSPFDDESPVPTGADFHRFGGFGGFLPIVLPPKCGVELVLQWAEPQANGEGGAVTDLDLLLCTNPNAADCEFASQNPQGCSVNPDDQPFGDPIEILAPVINESASQDRTVYLAINHFCGPTRDLRFRIVTMPLGDCRGALSPQQSCSLARDLTPQLRIGFPASLPPKGQIYGNGVAKGAAAIAAISLRELETLQVTPPLGQVNVETFSSRGGEICLEFDSQGEPLETQDCRFRPQLTAPNRLDTSFKGFNQGCGCHIFTGTSAAAPVAAAAAALLLEQRSGWAPDQILQLLQETAFPIDDPPELGGSGVIDITAALKRAAARPKTPTGLRSRGKSSRKLYWSSIAAADSYSIEIEIEGLRERFDDLQGTSLDVPIAAAGQEFRWRVLAVDDTGESPWSKWQSVGKATRFRR